MVGRVREQIPLFNDALDVVGQLTLCENGIIIKKDGNAIAPFSYIDTFQQKKRHSPNKVEAQLIVYDMLGMRRDFNFVIADTYFAMLNELRKR
ncbi:Uncharacterised protein [Candidatus Gugararchaeum adminiculabundum]|nr:Uncharacterised protein [Candidatus Gugararchaeum adminiculabundum]